jgi:DNA invertase Pin-like site-specific DNA recombinase
MNIGYARVSTADQTLDLQLAALKTAGCEKIFTDTGSGTGAKRKGREEALAAVQGGDTLVVWSLDRFGRSLLDLIEHTTKLQARNVGFKSLTEQIDTAGTAGKLIFHIFGALAQCERNLIRERATVGLVAARARGRRGGRPKSLDPKDLELLKKLYADENNSIEDICRILNISKTTLYRYVPKR